jgi:ribosomal protein L29
LTPEERDNYFKVIALSSLPVDGMNTKHIQALQEAKKENSGQQGKANKEAKLKALKERLAMLVGQMNSGNDGNEEIIKEVKWILAQLVKWELMTNAQVATFVKRYVK